MLCEILKKRFEEAQLMERQLRGLHGYVRSQEDHYRVTCFENLQATIDLIPELLANQTKPFQAISQRWFDVEVRGLCYRIGFDFFPETASEFVWRLLSRISHSIPDQFRLQQIERWHLQAEEEDLAFGDPDPPVRGDALA